MAKKQRFHMLPYQLTMNATIVALPLALAKSLKAEPVVSGCRFAAPYFPMTHLKPMSPATGWPQPISDRFCGRRNGLARRRPGVLSPNYPEPASGSPSQ